MSEPEPKLTAKDFPCEVLGLFDQFVHGGISRRTFLDRCTAYVGTAAAAAGVLASLSPDFARAQAVAPEDKRIRTRRVEISSPEGSGSIKAYVAAPHDASAARRRPVVLVIHENRGLNPHIEDIARRLAVDGYVTVAPDALTKLGGYPGDEDKARALFGQLDQAKIGKDFIAAAHFALALPEGNGRLGAVGFCYGGGIVSMLAGAVPQLRAAVPFYGTPPAPEAIPAIKAEMLVNLAGNDSRIGAMWPPAEQALDKAQVRYHVFVYPGVEHGFNNNTTPRYDKAAASLAWERTLALFKRTLG
ncbi:MAG: prolyl oligopeptidase family protein [Alphaproteobacteria bacterium]|nr:prolyl oligopeptidase family protein [Alphaproteobacteria bacterium]